LYPEATITQDFRFTPSSLTPTLVRDLLLAVILCAQWTPS
jgi:hypothetical protein